MLYKSLTDPHFHNEILIQLREAIYESNAISTHILVPTLEFAAGGSADFDFAILFLCF
jgi:hypothetical protein